MRARVLRLLSHDFIVVAPRYFQGNDLRSIEFAHAKALYAHNGQPVRHKGDAYIKHPERVAKSMIAKGLRRADYICLALVHDIFEDCAFLTRADIAEIRDTLGSDMVDDLHTISKRYKSDEIRPSQHSESNYYQTLRHAPRRVQIVKMFDRLDNLIDIHEDHIPPDKRERVKDTTRTHFMHMAREMLHVMSRTDEMRHIVQFLYDEFERLSKG